MYAIIKTGGKQYRVAEGDIINVEKLEVAVDEKIALKDVLFVNDGETTYVGKPVVEGAEVEAEVLAEGKSEKHGGQKPFAWLRNHCYCFRGQIFDF